jgi:DNA-directed RNA polymerase specialized sigma subunit
MSFRKIKGHVPRHWREKRNKEIFDLWIEKQDEMSLKDIGHRYHLTQQRVSQILIKQKELALSEEAER